MPADRSRLVEGRLDRRIGVVALIVPKLNLKDLSMNALVAQLILSSHGYFHETSGMVIAFFENPQEALRCADAITVAIGKIVEVCGTRLSIS